VAFPLFPLGSICIQWKESPDRARTSAPMEAWMPRFLGRKIGRLWWDVVTLIVLVLVVILVLELTGTTHLFS
jgi:hypothetical protein